MPSQPMTEIEVVARAISANFAQSEDYWEIFVESARAAIVALDKRRDECAVDA